MGEWKTIYDDEVEGRWVTLKVYESEKDEDGDDEPIVRVTVAPMEHAEADEGGQKPGQGQGQMRMTTPSHWILI